MHIRFLTTSQGEWLVSSLLPGRVLPPVKLPTVTRLHAHETDSSSPLPMTTVEPTKQPDFLLCFTLKEYIVAKQKEQENDDKGLARLFPGRLARTVPDSPTSDRSAECGLAWDSEAFDIPFDVGFDDLFLIKQPVPVHPPTYYP
ncbi:hypothetical protein PAPYR_9187 [Paratrimastix pyriformis]|uniref:Uncharacterized protein n=1 Tax=Paratrimastix pyriformis TaxID=342808 RepID=A0ABQ8UDN5_9EUKA|nr:hypothetical protein PAPYR_9187 [Paratrimastix pyriformis]